MSLPTRVVVKHAKPLLSNTEKDARLRVLNLYKAWYRQIPFIVVGYHIPKSAAECRQKLREEFMKNAHVTDVRVIDMLVIKGMMDLQEAAKHWKTDSSIMNYWRDTWNPKPKDFMSKFLAGQD